MKNVDPFIHYCSLINESINEFHGIKPISSGNLDTFTKAFMEAFLMDINEFEKERSKEEREDGLNLHLIDYELRDMDPRSLKKIIKDCKKFQDDNIEEIEKGGAGLDDPYESAGYDFYFTRNGHGVGFWETDKWEDPYGKQLTAAAKKFGGIDGYVGDDHKVYVMGAEKDWTAGGVIQGVSVPKKEKPYKDSYEDDDVNEAVSSEESQQREIKSIVDKCRTITANYIKLLNNRRVSQTKLLEYVQTKINPMIEYMETYLENSTPQEKKKFKMFMKELMTSSWLDVDAAYWEEEMSKMVGGAVIYGEVGLENLEDLANQGNRDIDKLREGGSKIKEPHAGITSDMSGRWRIKAFDTSKHGKKETPPMKEVVGINNAAIHEIGLFYQKASDELIRKFESLLNAGDEKGALSVVEKFHNVKFQGDLATRE